MPRNLWDETKRNLESLSLKELKQIAEHLRRELARLRFVAPGSSTNPPNRKFRKGLVSAKDPG